MEERKKVILADNTCIKIVKRARGVVRFVYQKHNLDKDVHYDLRFKRSHKDFLQFSLPSNFFIKERTLVSICKEPAHRYFSKTGTPESILYIQDSGLAKLHKDTDISKVIELNGKILKGFFEFTYELATQSWWLTRSTMSPIE